MNDEHEVRDGIRDRVRVAYAEIATKGTTLESGGCCGPSASCCEANRTAEHFGYNARELESLPDGADMGLSCGNPTAIASLKPGEVVIDLGSGGGLDCFIAGPKVGPTGRVIGIDMTAEMIAKARANAISYRKSSALDNVEFRLGEIEHLPVADSCADVVISNCVLNLSPDKPQVWWEIGRVLKPGGRVAVSDLALLKPLPEAIQHDIAALVGCIAGAVLIDETRCHMESAGFVDIVLTSKPRYIESMSPLQDPLYRRIFQLLPSGTNLSEFITSLDIAAMKRV